MKVNVVALGFVAAVSVSLGAGAWYINTVYLPKAQQAKAQALQTTAAPQEEAPSEYDYTIPVDGSAITAPGKDTPTPAGNNDALVEPAAGDAPSDEQQPSGQDDEPADVWITRDWSNGGESHVSTERPNVEEKPTPEPPTQPTAPNKPATTPSTTPQTSPPPAKPIPEPEPKQEPEPESTGVEEPAQADLPDTPRRGETRVVNGVTLTWYEGLGWIPEGAGATTDAAPANEDNADANARS